MVMLEEQAKLETFRPGRSLFVRKVRLGRSTTTKTPTTLQVLCVHGTCASEQQYHSFLESLNELILADSATDDENNVSIQCLLPDLLGCGQSPPASASAAHKDATYSNEEIMADILALMEKHVDPNIPLVIMGHSYACNVILPMLMEKKMTGVFQNLKACIFLSSAVRCPENPNPDGGLWIMRSALIPDMLLNYFQPTLTNSFVEMAVHPDHVALREQVKQASNGNNMQTARAYHRNHVWYAGLSKSSSALVGDLDVPVLVVHGAEDVIVPIAAGKSLATALSSISSSSSSGQSGHSSTSGQSAAAANVEFVTVERARHLVMMEQPEEVARAVWKFLRPLLV
jgi:pimeloyl-ACP methyl ester carboxylesterase